MINLENNKFVVISVIGTHAGESVKQIFARKLEEIKATGKTFWSYKSNLAIPSQVQMFGSEAERYNTPPLCIFIEASGKNGATPTLGNQKAIQYSLDNYSWQNIPQGIVSTGSVRTSYALVIDDLQTPTNLFVNLWDYSVFEHPKKAIKLILGGSTVCCIKESSGNDPNKIKSNIRKVLGIGKLASPYGVWLNYF